MIRPWMPLYIADYRVKTSHLGAIQHGAYLLLIMHYWTYGGLPEDDSALARIACMTTAEWRKHRQAIAAFFHDGWKHSRVDEELAKAADISSKRRASAGRRHSKSSANAEQEHSNCNANAEQMEAHTRASSQSQSHPEAKASGEKRARALVWPFDQFWALYPNKVGKQAALRSFEKVERSGQVTFENLMLGLSRYNAKTDDRAWCNPETWLNQGRWEDQPAQQDRHNVHRPSHHRTSHADATLAGMSKLARKYVGNGAVAGGGGEGDADVGSDDPGFGAPAGRAAPCADRAGAGPKPSSSGDMFEGEIIPPDKVVLGVFGRR